MIENWNNSHYVKLQRNFFWAIIQQRTIIQNYFNAHIFYRVFDHWLDSNASTKECIAFRIVEKCYESD